MSTIKIALRNILLHQFKTLIIGGILIVASFMAIIGSSVIDSISAGIKRGMIEGLTGHIQIYSHEIEETFSIFGSFDNSFPDIGVIPDFHKTQKTLLENIPEIKAVIPMGVNFALMNPGNILDQKLEQLRKLYQQKPKPKEEIIKLKEHIEQIVTETIQNAQDINKVMASTDPKDQQELIITSQQATMMSYGDKFDRDYEKNIEFLANKVAPLILDDNMVFFNYIGTDLHQFRDNFSQVEIIKGRMPEKGERGFLFNNTFYENDLKNRIARRLDQIKNDIDKHQIKISGNKINKDKIQTNINQYSEITSQMLPAKLRELTPKLQKLLNSNESNPQVLVKSFLDMNDENFMERYRFFYEHIAPHIVLHKYEVGDTFALTAFTKNGYSRSVNFKFLGTFRFKSFENSILTNYYNLMDIISYRELYGMITPEQKNEMKELEAEMGDAANFDTDPESLFTTKVKKENKTIKKKSSVSLSKRDQKKETFSDEDIIEGMVQNAAVILHNQKDIPKVIGKIKEISQLHNLKIQAIDWESAAGFVGQMIQVVGLLLYLSVAILFIIAAFIIMNSMLMAALDRTVEIGTMRAIGAPKSFILKLFFIETFFLSAIFTGIGGLAAFFTIKLINLYGIPATSDTLAFFFSGQRLYLSFSFTHVAGVVTVVFLIALLSTLYPAWRAGKIKPIVAMQKP